IGNVGVLRNYRMQVWNRFGQIVFETNNPLKKWDGKINGFFATGTFVFYAQYSIAGRRNAFQKGTFVIVR
ncbi:MAG: gliding motility-associated C-terminal domain-containing protein, partial [Chitinophagaceae bacterium]